MWELYKLLGKSGDSQYLIDSVVHLMQNNHPSKVRKSLKLMYNNAPSNSLQYGLMLVNGLKKNNYFEFQKFVESLSGNR